jgi:hypothetical protein
MPEHIVRFKGDVELQLRSTAIMKSVAILFFNGCRVEDAVARQTLLALQFLPDFLETPNLMRLGSALDFLHD